MKKNLLMIIGNLFCIIFFLLMYLIMYNNSSCEVLSFKFDTIIELEENEIVNWNLMPIRDIDLNNQTIEICDGGVYHLTGNIDDGYIIIGTNSYVKLILDNVKINNSNGPCIIINNARQIVIELARDSVNYLTDGFNYDNVLYDGCLFSKSNLVLQGNGTLNIVSNYKDGIVCNDNLKILSGNYIIDSVDDGIRGNDSIYVSNGTFDITSGGDSFKVTNIIDNKKGFMYIENGNFVINSYGDGFEVSNSLIINDGVFKIKTKSINGDKQSKKGFKALGNIIINNGKFTMDNMDDSFNSKNNMYIENGNFIIQSRDDGIKAINDLIIKNSNLVIKEAYEGIEGGNVYIYNGSYNIKVRDDGINVKKDDDDEKTREQLMVVGNLLIENGNFIIEAEADGFDVNGNITINNGTIFIDAASIMSENAVDYNGYCNINGGILIGVSGHNLLAQGASDTSKQHSLMYYLTEGYSPSEFLIIDNDNKEVFRYKTKKEYRNIFVSSKNLEKNKIYSLKIGGKTISKINLTSMFNDDYNKEKEKEILER